MSNPNRRWKTLSQELEELERTDPTVARAARNLDEAFETILSGGTFRDRARRNLAARKVNAARQAMWRCPDGGYCHHACERACYRVLGCAPFSDEFPNDEWPPAVEAAHRKAAGLKEPVCNGAPPDVQPAEPCPKHGVHHLNWHEDFPDGFK